MSTLVNGNPVYLCTICGMPAEYECPCDTELYYCTVKCQLKAWYDLNHEFECSTNPNRKRAPPGCPETDSIVDQHEHKRIRINSNVRGETELVQKFEVHVQDRGVCATAGADSDIEKVHTTEAHPKAVRCIPPGAVEMGPEQVNGRLAGSVPGCIPNGSDSPQSSHHGDVIEHRNAMNESSDSSFKHRTDTPGGEKYTCMRKGCGERYESRNELDAHQAGHVIANVEKRHPCLDRNCGESFDTNRERQLHTNTRHPQLNVPADNLCKCGCAKKKTAIERSRQHQRMHPDQTERDRKRELAQKHYRVSRAYTKFAPLWPQKCLIDDCGKCMVDLEDSIRHRRTAHNGSICNWMGCGLFYVGSWDDHFEEYHGYPALCFYHHRCPFSGFSEESMHYFNCHTGFHVCLVCGAKMPSKSNLAKHKRLHKVDAQ